MNSSIEDLLGAELQTMAISGPAIRKITPGDDAVSLCSVWTSKPYNRELFKSMMCRLRRTSESFQFVEMGENLYKIIFANQNDKERIMAGRPRLFDRHMIIMMDLREEIDHAHLVLAKTPIWLHVMGVPYLVDKQLLGRNIGDTFEMVEEIVATESELKMKVQVDCREPLRRGLFIQVGSQGRNRISFQYEKLPVFCYWCGIMGHAYKECSDLTHRNKEIAEADMPFGSALRLGTRPMRVRVGNEFGNRVAPRKYLGKQYTSARELTANGDELRGGLNVQGGRDDGCLSPFLLNEHPPLQPSATHDPLQLPQQQFSPHPQPQQTLQPSQQQGSSHPQHQHKLPSHPSPLQQSPDHNQQQHEMPQDFPHTHCKDLVNTHSQTPSMSHAVANSQMSHLQPQQLVHPPLQQCSSSPQHQQPRQKSLAPFQQQHHALCNDLPQIYPQPPPMSQASFNSQQSPSLHCTDLPMSADVDNQRHNVVLGRSQPLVESASLCACEPSDECLLGDPGTKSDGHGTSQDEMIRASHLAEGDPNRKGKGKWKRKARGRDDSWKHDIYEKSGVTRSKRSLKDENVELIHTHKRPKVDMILEVMEVEAEGDPQPHLG